MVEPERTARNPAGLRFQDAVAMVVCGGTAYEGLIDRGKVQPGETVLVTAASGGVGTVAVQIAAAAGARVFGVASARNLDYVRGIGAVEAFDYSQAGWSRAVRDAVPGGVDLLFDAAGGDTGKEAMSAVRDGGRASLVAFPAPELDSARGLSGEAF